MPYRKRYNARRRTYKRRQTYSRKTPWWGPMAIKSLSGIGLKLLKSKLGLNTETHWLDSVETNVATSNTCTPMAYPLSIPVDDTVNGRTGNEVRARAYSVKGRIQANTAATTGCLVRVLFVKFNDVRGRTAALDQTDFLDSTTRITSKFNMGDTADATGYTVLYDRTYKISINGQENDTQVFSFTYKPLNWHLKWIPTDTTGAQSALMTSAVRGYIMTSETGANTPNYWADHRVTFVDN